MKKVFCMVLFIVLICCSIAHAEIDLSGMTRDELIDLRKQVELALFGMELTDGVELPSGRYVGGKDIPIGDYILTSKTDGEDIFISLSAFASETDDGGYTDRENFKKDGQTYRIEITDGKYIVIRNSNGTGRLILKAFSTLFNNSQN